MKLNSRVYEVMAEMILSLMESDKPILDIDEMEPNTSSAQGFGDHHSVEEAKKFGLFMLEDLGFVSRVGDSGHCYRLTLEGVTVLGDLNEKGIKESGDTMANVIKNFLEFIATVKVKSQMAMDGKGADLSDLMKLEAGLK